MKQQSRIFICQCANASILPLEMNQAVRQALNESGLAYDTAPDLCELAAHKAPLLAELADSACLTIGACHPRAVKWLFAAGGAPLQDDAVSYLNMREAPAEQILDSIHEMARSAETAERLEHSASMPLSPVNPDTVEPAGNGSGAPAWKPWFPVIDYARCQNCRQCLGFCLFGVYGADPDGKVQVANPASCKTDCPACARVCPETAIIFPKYPHAPINGGECKESDGPYEPIKLDRAAMTRGDILKALRERSQGGARFAPDPGRVKALQERFVQLTGSQRFLEIPLRTLAAQPSAKKETE